jgi:hypothetical protein
MTRQTVSQKACTIADYLDLEINLYTRHEYIDGEIIPMTGGTPERNEIASVLNAVLRVSFKGSPTVSLSLINDFGFLSVVFTPIQMSCLHLAHSNDKRGKTTQSPALW